MLHVSMLPISGLVYWAVGTLILMSSSCCLVHYPSCSTYSPISNQICSATSSNGQSLSPYPPSPISCTHVLIVIYYRLGLVDRLAHICIPVQHTSCDLSILASGADDNLSDVFVLRLKHLLSLQHLMTMVLQKIIVSAKDCIKWVDIEGLLNNYFLLSLVIILRLLNKKDQWQWVLRTWMFMKWSWALLHNATGKV